MPAKSKSQQRFFGLVKSVQDGSLEDPSPAVAAAAKSMSKSEVDDFATTKHKDLPDKVKKEIVEDIIYSNREKFDMVNENIDYSDEKYKELKKKKYKSNAYWEVYVGKNGDYTEIPWHVYVWNKFNPTARVKANDGNLIHHKDENKDNNAPSNLKREKKGEHDSHHLAKRRKEQPSKFSKATSSKGGKNAQKNKKNGEKKTVKEDKEVVTEIVGLMTFASITMGVIISTAVTTIIQLIIAANQVKKIRLDEKVSDKLTKIINDGKKYTVRRLTDKKIVNAFAFPHTGDIVYYTRLKELLGDREFYAILLHEAGHVNQKQQGITFKQWAAHSTVLTIMNNAMVALGMFTGSLVSLGGGVILLIVFRKLVLDLIPLKVSRIFEYDADSYAVNKGYGKDLASALVKFAKYYNQEIKPCKTVGCRVSRKLEEVYSTHPQIADRIEGLLKKSELYKEIMKGNIKASLNYAASYLKISIGSKAMNLFTKMFSKMKRG
jgi:Zn-dependent protease with chaperone function